MRNEIDANLAPYLKGALSLFALCGCGILDVVIDGPIILGKKLNVNK